MTIEQRKKAILSNIKEKIKGKNEAEKKIILKEVEEVAKTSYIELEKHNDLFND